MAYKPPRRGGEDDIAATDKAVTGKAADLQAALDQQSALLHELDHRVKNNLQLISSLMLMQSRRTKDPAVREALAAMHSRLNAVGVVHRRLFQSEDVAHFDLAEFVRDMAAELSGPSGRKDIRFKCRLEAALVPAAQAAALALMLNELLTNAFRHGFPDGRAGRISVTIANLRGGLRIEISDDGVGVVREDESDERGFGLTIVNLLARQLQARIVRENANPGLRVIVTLPPQTREEL